MTFSTPSRLSSIRSDRFYFLVSYKIFFSETSRSANAAAIPRTVTYVYATQLTPALPLNHLPAETAVRLHIRSVRLRHGFRIVAVVETKKFNRCRCRCVRHGWPALAMLAVRCWPSTPASTPCDRPAHNIHMHSVPSRTHKIYFLHWRLEYCRLPLSCLTFTCLRRWLHVSLHVRCLQKIEKE